MFIKKEQVSSHPASNAKVEHRREGREGDRKASIREGKSSGKEGGEGKWRMHL